MTDTNRNSRSSTDRLEPPASSQPRFPRWVKRSLILLCILTPIGWCTHKITSSFGYLDEYEVLDRIIDQETGKIVQLGVFSNFSSSAYTVAVLDQSDPDRIVGEYKKQQIIIIGYPGATKLEYDGKCYFVRATFRQDWGRVRPYWRDPETGKTLCFYVLTPMGEKLTDAGTKF